LRVKALQEWHRNPGLARNESPASAEAFARCVAAVARHHRKLEFVKRKFCDELPAALG
jgi:hypothetical protein